MKIEFSPEAEADLREIADYISQDNRDAARRVVDLIAQSVRQLATLPRIGRPGTLPDSRELLVPRLPYRIVYRIESDAIFIINIIHTRRNWP